MGNARAADAIELIEQVLDLLSRARELELAWSDHPEGEAGAIDVVRRELEAVRGGELRMSVVAPMKAGKSTLINSVVGYELLPARAAAMTTLPTRIVLDQRVHEAQLTDHDNDHFAPVLELREEDAAQFNLLVKALRAHVSKPVAGGLLKQYPHLATLVNDILSDRIEDIGVRYEGRAAVQKCLTLLNDLVRLAGRVMPDGWKADLADVPVVRTPYWSVTSQEAEGPGRLVIVDTPGPDEHDLADMLTAVVRRQLSESHIVLVVLDYTKMGGKSDAQIRELMEPLLSVVGTEKLFAVVNKIDQKRRETDLDDEGIVRSACANLGLTDSRASSRVFTVSAEWALASVQVLAALARSDDAPVADGSAARLARLLYPVDWQDQLEDMSPGRLRKSTKRALEFSRINQFLVSVVAWLRMRVLRLAVDAALDKAAAELSDLQTATLARRDLIGRESEDLAAAARQISADLDAIAGFRSQVSSPSKLAGELAGQLSKRELKRAEAEGEKVVEEFRDTNSHSWGRNPMAMLTGRFTRGDGALEFATQEAAEEYVHAQTFRARQELDAVLERARTHIESRVGASAEEQVRRQSERVRPVVVRAADRMKDEFNVTFSIPAWELGRANVAELPTELQTETKATSRKIEREYHQRSWRRLWLWKSTYAKTETEITEERTYLVRPDAMATGLQVSFEERLKEIHAALGGHVREMITQQVSQYYDQVEAFLQRYRHILQQSAEDNQLQEMRQVELRESLTGFLDATRALHSEVRHLRGV
ncbi:dynamin family protein [Streptomyces purpurascens]|uniref:Dynamin family protein n=1 Tax=Streptomyces purpurascens TaxID=1924 RepID=A0ABZ1MJ79_STREF|nr:dynamin family protein [Streptomyces purpurascens]MCE7049386.1 dynamin family protein [Streptomyces purpurascens]